MVAGREVPPDRDRARAGGPSTIIDIYAVVSMDPGDQTVRLEFAVKQGVRPFGPQLLANQRFSLDASFREFFFSKRTFWALPGGHLFL